MADANSKTTNTTTSTKTNMGTAEEFEILLGFEPPDPEALRRWFAEEDK